MARIRRYRGRGKARRMLTVILFLLGILLVISAVLFVVLPNYLVYTADGQPYFDIPFLNRWREPTPTPEASAPPTAPPPTSSPSPEPTPSPSPTPRSALPLRALYAPISVLADESALEVLRNQFARGQADALVLELKAGDGTLAYPSSLPPAIQAQVSSEGDAAARLIRELKAGGVYIVARVACFKDARLPQQIQTVGIKHVSGVNWLDNQRERWLDPYKQDACDYLLGVLSEVAGLGVDEILLDWLTFPTKGSLSVISYGAFADTPRYEAIEAFAQRARDTVASSGAALSAVLSEETCVNGEDEVGGQRLSALAPVFDRFYVSLPLSTETGTVFETLTAGLDAWLPRADWPARLVPMLPVTAQIGPEALRIALDAAGGQLGLGWLLENSGGRYPELTD